MSNAKSSFRFLLTGGWLALRSAVLSSVFLELVNHVIGILISIWQHGIQTFMISSSELQGSLLVVAIFTLLAILGSIFPALIGGVLLAWLLKQNKLGWLTTLHDSRKLGSIIGVAVGIVLTLLVLWYIDSLGRIYEGGVKYDLISSLPTYMLYTIEIILTATIAGRWTEGQLRNKLESADPNTSG